MKSPVLARSRALLFAALLAGFGTSLSAGVVFSYGPSDSYVSSDRSFNRPAAKLSSSPFVFSTSFNDTNPLRTVSADYSGPVIYGGYRFSSSTLDSGITTQSIRNNRSFGGSTFDTIGLQSSRSGGWAGSDLTLHGVYVFKQADFVPEVASATLAVDGITLRWSGSGSAAAGETFAFTGRFVVQVADAYYVSETTIDLVGNNRTYSLAGASLASERWAPYAPTSSLNFNQSAASFSALALQGVTAVGVYFENDGWAGTNTANAAYTFEVIEFSVSGSAIPEPSSAVALTGLLALGAVATRRSRRASRA